MTCRPREARVLDAIQEFCQPSRHDLAGFTASMLASRSLELARTSEKECCVCA